jgi:hypothetical protein
MVYFVTLLLAVVVNEGLAELLSKSLFFGPVRTFVDGKESPFFKFVSKAITCPYCSSVWTSLLLTILIFVLFTPSLSSVVILDAFLFLVACHRLSNHFHDIADRYFSKDYK